MSTMATYKTLDGGTVQEVFPDPAPAAGYSLNTNFRAIADSLPRNNYGASTNPGPDNDSADSAHIGVEFAKGSRWYNGTAIFECVDPTPTEAVWVGVIENIDGNVSLQGANLNLNNGSGTGGGNISVDGGQVGNLGSLVFVPSAGYPFYGVPAIASQGEAILIGDPLSLDGGWAIRIDAEDDVASVSLHAGTLNANDGSGAGGGNWNLDSGSISFGSGGSLSDNGSGQIAYVGPGNAAFQINDGNRLSMGIDSAIVFNEGQTIVEDDAGGFNFNGASATNPVNIDTNGNLSLNGGTLNFGSGGFFVDDGSNGVTFQNSVSGGASLDLNYITDGDRFEIKPSGTNGALMLYSASEGQGSMVQLYGNDFPNWGRSGNLVLSMGGSSNACIDFIQDDGSGANSCMTLFPVGGDGAAHFNLLGITELNLHDGSGSGGKNLNMDGGIIVRMRADNQSSAPASPNPGQIYFDTSSHHFFGWNGTAWKQLDN